jgi:geranylgeranyl diphosphate synthase, type II
MSTALLESYLDDCRSLVNQELHRIIPNNRYRTVLYDLMLDYPLRHGKAFRPSLCIATCRALGGRIQDVLPTAAVIELFHNAFLVHDDLEDGSLMRRGAPTLHRQYGVPIAVNVGDGMHALCLQPLLDNMQLLGLGNALRILELVARMARESVEGQAIELDWVRQGCWTASDHDYCRMTYKKTCWYTFITPIQIGAVVSGASAAQLGVLRRFATFMGVAFQIQDDVLNLAAEERRYGKEIGGDLWEGKHTVMLLHMMRAASPTERELAELVLRRPRQEKTVADVEVLMSLIHRYGSIDYAKDLSQRLAGKAAGIFQDAYPWMPASVHRDFLFGMAEHVVTRDK